MLLLLGFHITIGIFIVSNHHSILETSLNGIVSNPELTIFMLFFGLAGSGL
ncbi:hypothetical protein [uncultured Dokdonia sp.]|uniref:hypothetical protein n=1 Tax=uncultured Dokdonia sp. TaxID=575653 RepID=UPI002638A827|nr:hypothetical protein [uncultured Dokdonia sp.]